MEDVVEQIRFLLDKKSTKITSTNMYINAGRLYTVAFCIKLGIKSYGVFMIF